MLCAATSRWKYLSYIPLLLAGQLSCAREICFLRATDMLCEPINEEPVWVQVDGELAGRLPAQFRIIQDALTLAVPQPRNT
jgi:diacylglycerol kinase family enzyme